MSISETHINPPLGCPTKKNTTFKTKHDFEKKYQTISPENLSTKATIYGSWSLTGEWSIGPNNERNQEWYLGYYVCSGCDQICGLHDSGEYHKLRVEAAENLNFASEKEKETFLKRKSANSTMKEHNCKNASKSNPESSFNSFQTPISAFQAPISHLSQHSTSLTSSSSTDLSTPNTSNSEDQTNKKRKITHMRSIQISSEMKAKLKDLQVLVFSTLNIAFTAADSPLFFIWMALLFEILSNMDGGTVGGLVLGSTALQTRGVDLHGRFKSMVGKLIRGELVGLLAEFSVSTDGWTSCDKKSFVDVTLRIWVTFANGGAKLFTLTVDLLELGIKDSGIQYDKSANQMCTVISRSFAQFGFTLPLKQVCSTDNTSSALNLSGLISESSSPCITHRGNTCFTTTLDDHIFNPKSKDYCPIWHALHVFLMLIIEYAAYLINNAPAIGMTRKFRSYQVAYSWVHNNTNEAVKVIAKYKLQGNLNVALLGTLVPMFEDFAETIDMAENISVLRSEKLIIAQKFRTCSDLLPKTTEFNRFKRIFTEKVNEKIFGEVLCANDYLCTMMIPHQYFKTLGMLTRFEANQKKKQVLTLLGKLIRPASQISSEDESEDENNVADFFKDLEKKHKANDEESFLRTYAKSKNHPEDLQQMSMVNRCKITLEFWSKYPIKNGDHHFASVVREQLVGSVGSNSSERSFSTTKKQNCGTVYSEPTASFKLCLKTGKKSGLYDLLM